MNAIVLDTVAEQPLSLADLLREIAERRDEIDAGRHVPRDLIASMKRAGIFRSATPRMFGGDAMAPHAFLRMIEAIGTADGSAAWVAAFGSANTYLAALPVETQREIYRTGPDQVFAGGLYPLQPAQPAEGGWLVSGRWRFASGCKGADWIGVGIATGTNASGVPQTRIAVAPAAEVEIIETWDVVGMQGTGSHDTTVHNKFYSEAWTCLRGSAGVIDEPLYRYPTLPYQAQVHAACNLGLARAAIDIVRDMADAAKIMPGAPRLADRGYFRSGLARGEAAFRAAQAFFYDAAEAVWEILLKGDEPSAQDINAMRLSATFAAHTCAQVIRDAYAIAGMSAIHKSHRLQQIVRDSMVVTQHVALSEATYEDAGAILCGAG